MSSKTRLLVLLLLCNISVYAQSKTSGYHYTVDLTKVVDDKVAVELTPPKITKDEVIFSFPKIVPGTYAIYDFGRLISEFHAFDKKGAELPVTKLNDNEWKITKATKLTKITYLVEDSYDTKVEGPSIFQPAGTNTEEGKNFVINNGAYFGYFKDLKETGFELNIIRDKDFYGATGMIAAKTNEPLNSIHREKEPAAADKRVDQFNYENYDRFVDSPLMYSKADTAVIKVANAEVLIASYSPTGQVTAKQIAATVHDVLMAQKDYLGGKLPVDKYAFIFYFTDQPVTSYGALEHSYSSFYYMPENTIGEMEAQLRDFVSHEFFHVITPLTIHSEEIQHFDFNDPAMSKHLWLYEGVTEYFAGNMQVQYGLITPDQYLKVLRQKMQISDNFIDNVPFTDISKFTLDKYQNQYYNVYQKGALIGLCLDLRLRKLSQGKYGMRNLIFDLSKKYGKTQAFKDDALFEEITKLTYPEIGDFLNRYVGGTEPLPLKETLAIAGVNYDDDKRTQEFSLGFGFNTIALKEVNGKTMIGIAHADRLDAQGKALQFKDDDALVKIDGENFPAPGPELSGFFAAHKAAFVEDKSITYTVLRKNESGEWKEVELSAPAKKIETRQRHILSFDTNADAQQLLVRKSWLEAEGH